ncbi:MAG TPA: DUF4147 domain-containing protein, partial [Vicinamibacterales bacterium]|nr:DUF4147 domain-containing protein [Vicinamibacterales bacterium]
MLRAAVDGVDAGRLVRRALADPDVAGAIHCAAAVDVVAAGKASGVMLEAYAAAAPPSRAMLAIGPARPAALPEGAEWHTGGHPLPT